MDECTVSTTSMNRYLLSGNRS
ncbi:unnamed protein product [Oppiella nova]|uniref:Uncharacterized protein n=1 Tax=Oppiella nova TaxID=334625 RepID=A0A7R9MVC6_9ACAR|nr:unnamed protein product [Oppiella nova]CAG2184098.1 unnamed protein product [Oppiella nova]